MAVWSETLHLTVKKNRLVSPVACCVCLFHVSSIWNNQWRHVITASSPLSLAASFIPAVLRCQAWERSRAAVEQSPGRRATRPRRHAGCHAAPGHRWRIGRRRRRGRWNQTLSRYLPALWLQLGFLRPCSGLQERLGERGQPGRPCLGPKLHHAAGQRRAQVCRCASATQRSFQLQR